MLEFLPKAKTKEKKMKGGWVGKRKSQPRRLPATQTAAVCRKTRRAPQFGGSPVVLINISAGGSKGVGRIRSGRSGRPAGLTGVGAGPAFPPVTLPLRFAPSRLTIGAIKLSRSQPRVFSLCTITGETFGARCRFFTC